MSNTIVLPTYSGTASRRSTASRALLDNLAAGETETLRIPLTAFPFLVCNRLLQGDKKLQGKNHGTDMMVEATIFVAPGGKQLWANLYVWVHEPKKDWSTFEGARKKFPIYTSSKRILAIASPTQGRINVTRHVGSSPFTVLGGSNDPVATYVCIADTHHKEDLAHSGAAITWRRASIIVKKNE